MARKKSGQVVRYRTRTVVKRVGRRARKGLASLPRPRVGTVLKFAVAVYAAKWAKENGYDFPYISETGLALLIAMMLCKSSGEKRALMELALAYSLVTVLDDSGALDALKG